MLKLYYYLQSKIQTTELSLSQKIEKKLNEPYNSNLFYFNVIFLNIALVFWQIAVDAAKLLIILTRDPGISFNIFFKQRELRSCPFSYHYFKSIQQKVRVFSLAGMSAMVIVTVITSLITNLIFGGTPPGRAATYTYSEGWASYASASNLSIAANLLSLNLLSGSFIQTNNGTTTTGFNLPGATFVNSILNGTGDTSIRLATTTQGLSFTQTDDTANTSGPSTLSGGFNNSGNVKSNAEVVGTGSSALIRLSTLPSNQVTKVWGVGGTDGNTAPGTYSWTVPNGVTSFTATVNGAGGNGGGRGGYYNNGEYCAEWCGDNCCDVQYDFGCDDVVAGSAGGPSSVTNGTQTATANGGNGGPPGGGGGVSNSNVNVVSSSASGGSAGSSYWGSGDTSGGCSVNNSYAVNGGSGGNLVATFNSASGVYTITVGSGANNGSVTIVYSTAIVYNSSGSYISYVDGGASPTVWNTFRFNRSLTAGGSGAATANFKVRSGDSATIPPADLESAGCTITDSQSGVAQALSSSCAGTGRYMWYKATLVSENGTRSPQIDDVIISRKTLYQPSGSFTSGIMDVGQKTKSSTLNISWNETVPTGASSAKVQVTSSNENLSDNFNTSSLNTEKWNAATGGSLDSNRYKITSQSTNSVYPNLTMKNASLIGDFDVQADYDISSLTAAAGKNTLIQILTSQQFQCMVTQSGALNSYNSAGSTVTTPQAGYTAQLTGKLRATRTSNTINCYLLDANSNGWVNFARMVGGTDITGNAKANLMLADQDNANNLETVYFDNFIVWGNNLTDTTGSFFGPAGTSNVNDTYTVNSGQALNAIHNGSQWFRYKAIFATSDTATSTMLNDLTFSY
ncbi:MAG: hypothetical protein UT48_C0024G0001, partial [Parcubacteria group bacterium GW2011_GWE2_39_37]